jgi:catechol 2,3-dioxygenase-like lactoylglutathione lyase family enzyme
MIDHVSVPVRDLVAATRFYQAVLAPLGLNLLVERDGTAGFGKRYPEFWLNLRSDHRPVENPGAHVCLRAKDESAVEAFHREAVSAGAGDDGAPGPRQGAMTVYFGAFVIDPDGNKIEVVTFPRQT